MSNTIPDVMIGSSAAEDRWHFLYRTAAIAALISVALFLFQIVAFFVWPPPSTVAGHFALLHARPLVGLVSLDFVIIVDEVLGIPLLLALYLSLRRVHESLVLIATGLSVVSTVCFLSGNPSLNMLYLIQQYAAATTAAARDGLLGAGQAVLSSWLGTPYQAAYVVGTIAMLIISSVMLRSAVFTKFTAYVGIVAGIVSFGLYVPRIGVYLSILSVVAMQVWYVMIALTLFWLSRHAHPPTIDQKSRNTVKVHA
jgi:hypothetical protein